MEHKRVDGSGRAWGARCRSGWQRGCDSKAPKIELPSLQAGSSLPQPSLWAALHMPLSRLICYNCTPPPLHSPRCPRDSRNLSNVSNSKCWRKRSKIKVGGETLSLGLCLCMASHNPPSLSLPQEMALLSRHQV